MCIRDRITVVAKLLSKIASKSFPQVNELKTNSSKNQDESAHFLKLLMFELRMIPNTLILACCRKGGMFTDYWARKTIIGANNHNIDASHSVRQIPHLSTYELPIEASKSFTIADGIHGNKDDYRENEE